MSNQIKVSPGSELIGLLGPKALPSIDTFRELVIAAAMSDDHLPPEVLAGILTAYIEMNSHLCENEDAGSDFDLIYMPESEQLYREFAVKGFRKGMRKDTSEFDDDEIFERCCMYEFEVAAWPDQLLADIAFAIGYRDAMQAQEFYRYASEQKGGMS